jgi:hypothetical protein
MKVYKPTRPCPKCAGIDTGDLYHKANECRYARNECKDVDGKEHIARHCRRCHYQWAELCVGEATNA